MTTRRDILKSGAGLAAILASGKAPAAFVKSMLAARNSIGMRAGGAKLPYDAVVEYLESTGTQYTNTGVIGGSLTRAEISAYSNNTTTTAALFGARSSNSTRSFVIFQHGTYDRTGVCFDYATSTGSSYVVAENAWAVGSVNTVKKDGTNNYVNNTQAASNPSYTFQCEFPFFLFACNNVGTPLTPFTGRVYSCKIYQDDTLVRDYIPVRRGTTGELYDRVSGKFAERHGDFVLGPDVVPVEWLGSDGNQYIDTGVVVGANNNLELIADMSVFNIRAAYALLFGASSGGTYSDTKVLLSTNLSATDRVYAGYRRASNAFTLCTNGSLDITQRNTYRLKYRSLGIMTNNGAELSFTLPDPSGSSNSKTIQICNNNDRADYKVYSFWVRDNSNDIYKAIPVRVGTDATSWEGAMMDILTRSIYRNAGTGNFSYGADKA